MGSCFDCVVTVNGKTGVPGVFVAGEVAGIGGAHAALAEGELAGLMAARQLNCQVPDADLARARSERTHHRGFGDLVNEVFATKPGVFERIADDTLVCRCEEVTAGQIRAAAVAWGANVNFIKGVTRCGMGYCQGRICGSIVEELTAQAVGCPPGGVDYFHVRPPLKPVRVQELADMSVE